MFRSGLTICLRLAFRNGALFCAVGFRYDRRHTFEISEYGRRLAYADAEAGRVSVCFVALLSLGLPMLNGSSARTWFYSATLPAALAMWLPGAADRRDSSGRG